MDLKIQVEAVNCDNTEISTGKRRIPILVKFFILSLSTTFFFPHSKGPTFIKLTELEKTSYFLNYWENSQIILGQIFLHREDTLCL